MAKRYKRSIKDIATREQKLNDLYREVLKEVREANKRLEKLERGTKIYKRIKVRGKYKTVNVEFKKFGTGTWASRNLFSRLDEYVVNNRIVLPNNLKMGKLLKVKKAVGQFRASMTSTPKGIKQAYENVKKGINILLGDMKMSDEEVEDVYRIFKDKEVNSLIKATDIPSSEVLILLKSTIDFKNNYKAQEDRREYDKISDFFDTGYMSEDEATVNFFVDQIQTYAQKIDKDTVDMAERIIKRYFDIS